MEVAPNGARAEFATKHYVLETACWSIGETDGRGFSQSRLRLPKVRLPDFGGDGEYVRRCGGPVARTESSNKDAEYKVLWSRKPVAGYGGRSMQGDVGVVQTYPIFELKN